MPPIYAGMPEEDYSDFEHYKEITAINNRQLIQCAIEFALREEYEFFSRILPEALKTGSAKNVQTTIDKELRDWVDRETPERFSRSDMLAAILRFCLNIKYDEFDAYVLANTPSPEITPGSSIIESDEETRAMIEGTAGVDPYMEMDPEDAKKEIMDDIDSL